MSMTFARRRPFSARRSRQSRETPLLGTKPPGAWRLRHRRARRGCLPANALEYLLMRRRDDKRLFLPALGCFLAILAVAGKARGDEFHLKDGSKIVGTIVGFENGAFKVQTSYGFATVRKDSIAEIVPEEKKAAVDSGQQSGALKPTGFAAATPSSNPKIQPMPRPIPKYATAASKPTTASTATNVTPPAIAASSSSLLLPD